MRLHAPPMRTAHTHMLLRPRADIMVWWWSPHQHNHVPRNAWQQARPCHFQCPLALNMPTALCQHPHTALRYQHTLPLPSLCACVRQTVTASDGCGVTCSSVHPERCCHRLMHPRPLASLRLCACHQKPMWCTTFRWIQTMCAIRGSTDMLSSSSRLCR